MYILPQGKKTQTAHSNYKEIKLEINKNALNNKHIATEKVVNHISKQVKVKVAQSGRTLCHPMGYM